MVQGGSLRRRSLPRIMLYASATPGIQAESVKNTGDRKSRSQFRKRERRIQGGALVHRPYRRR
ncbi:unnamed protein product [Haemonchus placei]|uniref:Secreted protein n=1 Tax=Haemonchus placei TaxID=6290 RepID=A0A0N4W0S1_HAEPC|nr:unnamed protein product [Haemonchus placei]